MKILFVCCGNTCRSPMFAKSFEYYLKSLDIEYEVASAGTSVEDNAEINKNTISILQEFDLDFDLPKPQSIDNIAVESEDFVFAVDNTVFESLKKFFSLCNIYSLEKLFDLKFADPYGEDYQTYKSLFDKFQNIMPELLSFVLSSSK